MGEDRLIDQLISRAGGLRKRIVFPEGEDERIIEAAERLRGLAVAEPVLVGEEDAVRTAMAGLEVDESGLEVVDPSVSSRAEEYARVYGDLTDTPMRTTSLVVGQPLFYAALALHLGDADGMLGGAVYSSADFESVCLSVIGLQDEIVVPSSFFVMEVPGYEGGEDGVLVFADAALNANPDSEELASIAVATAHSARTFWGGSLGWRCCRSPLGGAPLTMTFRRLWKHASWPGGRPRSRGSSSMTRCRSTPRWCQGQPDGSWATMWVYGGWTGQRADLPRSGRRQCCLQAHPGARRRYPRPHPPGFQTACERQRSRIWTGSSS